MSLSGHFVDMFYRFRSFAASTFNKVTGRSSRDDEEDDIDWGREEVRAFIRPRDEEWTWNQ